MKIKNTSDFKTSYARPLLRKIFNQIKKRNYYLDETEENKLLVIEEDLIYLIENFFLKNNNIKHLYTVNGEMSLLDEKKMKEDRDSFKYYELSKRVYANLQTEIEFFIDANMNQIFCFDTVYTNSEKMDIFLNSSEIVRKVIEVIKDTQTKLYDEMEIYLDYFEIDVATSDPHQNKQSGLLSYITVLEKSNTHYVLEDKYGKKFYPIIVDIFLDYCHIMDTLNSYEADLKNKKKRYQKFKEMLVLKNDPIHPLFYYLLKFSKKERVDNVKRYVLKFYLKEFNQDSNINTLFRKLFLKKSKGREDYRPSNMEKYESQNHLFFGILHNFKYFL